MTVDCNLSTNCIGIENANAREGSYVEDVAIDNAPKYGLHVVVGDPISGLGAGYSGPYRNVTIQYPTCFNNPGSCSFAPIGVLVECQNSGCPNSSTHDSPLVVNFDSITASANGISNTGSGMGFFVNGVPTVITNSHFEFFTNNNIQLGNDTQLTRGVKIDNASVGTGVGIYIGENTYDVVLENLSGPSGNTTYQMVENAFPNNLNTPTFVNSNFLG